VLLPARNRKDLQDVPETTRQAMQFIFLETADDAVRAALSPINRNAAATADLILV